MMTTSPNQEPVITRTERGLTISGTRISIYDVMDFLKAQYPSKLIQDRFNLTDIQINAVLSYIEVNRPQVEAEYQEALRTREEIRQYWEDHNREHFARLTTKPHKLEQKTLWAKLVAQKAERISVKS